MLRLKGITVNCSDPQGLAGFWEQALGYAQRALWEPYAGLKDPGASGPLLTFQRDATAGVNHLHMDLYAKDPDVEVHRLLALGATKVRRIEEGDTWWWVMKDPAGNEFCVIAALGSEREG